MAWLLQWVYITRAWFTQGCTIRQAWFDYWAYLDAGRSPYTVTFGKW